MRKLHSPSQGRRLLLPARAASAETSTSDGGKASGAAAKLEALRRAREESDRASQTLRSNVDAYRRTNMGRVLDIENSGDAAPRHVDIRMYEGLANSRNRLSKKVAELQKSNARLSDLLASKDEALVEAFDCLTRAVCQHEQLTRLAEGAAAGVQFGVDQEDALKKLLLLQERLEFMHEKVSGARAELSSYVPRPVPVLWSGLASEVRLVGEFDKWGDGILLSSDSIDDHVFQRFEAHVPLLPGRYKVKFLVDGKWRLAPDWPTETDDDGETNNILVVDPDL